MEGKRQEKDGEGARTSLGGGVGVLRGGECVLGGAVGGSLWCVGERGQTRSGGGKGFGVERYRSPLLVP
jgi:hypothetical protein